MERNYGVKSAFCTGEGQPFRFLHGLAKKLRICLQRITFRFGRLTVKAALIGADGKKLRCEKGTAKKTLHLKNNVNIMIQKDTSSMLGRKLNTSLQTMITAVITPIVNGVKADYTADGAYWAFFVNGEYCNYGIEEQPVLDGDVFSIVYTAFPFLFSIFNSIPKRLVLRTRAEFQILLCDQ